MYSICKVKIRHKIRGGSPVGPCALLAFSPDGKTLAVHSGGDHFRFIDPDSGQRKSFVGRKE